MSLTQLVEVLKNPAMAAGKNESDILCSAAGIHDLAAKVLSVEALREFPTVLPHLNLIGPARLRVASLVQNRSSGPGDDTARKTAELYVGCLAMHAGRDVTLDSPSNNPPFPANEMTGEG